MKPNWNETYSSGRDFRVMNELLLDKILQNSSSDKKTALDIGCGTGDLSAKLANRGFRVTGMDLSDVAIEKAKGRANEAGVGEPTTFMIANISNLSKLEHFNDKTYDIIFCKLVLAFVENKQEFLDWVKDHMSANGSFVLVTPVLHQERDYTPRLKNISIDLLELTKLLNKSFANVREIHTEYPEELGDERTYILSN